MIRAVLLREHFAKATMEAEFLAYMVYVAGGQDELEILMENWRWNNRPNHPMNAFVQEATKEALAGHDIMPGEVSTFKFRLEIVR